MNIAKRPQLLFSLIVVVAFSVISFRPGTLESNNNLPVSMPLADGSPGLISSVVQPNPTFDNSQPYVPDQLVVKYKSGVSQMAEVEVATKYGATIAAYPLLTGYTLLNVPLDRSFADVASSLGQDPSIASVERNYYRYAYFTPNDPLYQRQWDFPQIQMPQAWDISNGNGVIVAVIDTGVAYENYGGYLRAPDLANTAFVPGYDFINNDSHPNDDYFHGTHVAGTIAQSTNNGQGVAGIAFGARIMPVKVLDNIGSGTDVTVANGIKWAVDNGARVINLSLGGPYPSSLMEDAVNYAHDRGVVVVAAAGNSNGPVGYPAAYTNAIAVGSVRYDQTRAYYSSFGPELDLVAPGGDTSVDQNGDGYPDGVLQQTFASGDPTNFGYYYVMGTSMAAPHVSGVAALLIASGAAKTPDEVRQALQSTAKDLGTPGWDQEYGYGLIQASDALPRPSFQNFLPNIMAESDGGW